jgi:8-oxo-dGTP diphosphatase
MMDLEEVREKAHYIAITGLVVRDGKYLICKRSASEKLFPNKWCLPGGKIQQSEFINTKKDTSDHWLNIFEKTLMREIREETGLEVEPIGYISSLAMLRPNGFSTIILALLARYKSGEVTLANDELSDYAWVSLEEAKNYDLIENIWEQIEKVDTRYKQAWIM